LINQSIPPHTLSSHHTEYTCRQPQPQRNSYADAQSKIKFQKNVEGVKSKEILCVPVIRTNRPRAISKAAKTLDRL
jgi:hypothetical protein